MREATDSDGGASWTEAETICQAEPDLRRVIIDLIVSVIVGAAVVVLVFLMFPAPHPWSVVLGLIPPLASAIRSAVVSIRGRVVLRSDVIEVRRILVRRYSLASLKSITLDEDGHIEITPNGWVRVLPIPRAEAVGACRLLMERFQAAGGTSAT